MADEVKVAAAFPKIPEFTVEVADEANRLWLCPILNDVLRGRWSRANCPNQQFTGSLRHMPDTPGIMIAVNVLRRQVRIWDPLADPKNAELWEKAKAAYKAHFNENAAPVKEVVKASLNDTDLKTWLYWIRRGVDSKNLVVLVGQVPDHETIRSCPGKTKIEFFNSNQKAIRTIEDRERADQVEMNRVMGGELP